jgi:hypothetical protein
MVQYKAHWYSIILPKNPMASDDLYHAVFPLLSKLTSIEEDMMRDILVHCKLVQYRRGIRYSPLLNGWEEFIREYELDDVEVTYYSISRKWQIYVRLSACSKAANHRTIQSTGI